MELRGVLFRSPGLAERPLLLIPEEVTAAVPGRVVRLAKQQTDQWVVTARERLQKAPSLLLISVHRPQKPPDSVLVFLERLPIPELITGQKDSAPGTQALNEIRIA